MSLKGGEKLRAKLRELGDLADRSATLKVGFLEGATYPNGTPVAMVAAIQEFGAPARGIPPRPFFRNMIAEKSPEWGTQLGTLLIASNYDAKKSLKLMGAGIKGQLQQSIIDTNSPPLAPATVAKKGNSKALVDTGHMLNSVDYEVSES